MPRQTHQEFKGSLQELRKNFNGAVLVCIDLENVPSNRRNATPRIPTNLEIGISILDTANMGSGIRTHNLVTGSAEYCNRAKARCYLGETEEIALDELEASIRRIYPASTSRDIILVGHSLGNDLGFLKSKGQTLDFAFAVDTANLAKRIHKLRQLPSLKEVSHMLDIAMPYRHSAGNDSHYALVALLGLACHGLPNTASTETDAETSGDEEAEDTKLQAMLSMAFEKAQAHAEQQFLERRPLGFRGPRRKPHDKHHEAERRDRLESQKELVRDMKVAMKRSWQAHNLYLGADELGSLFDVDVDT